MKSMKSTNKTIVLTFDDGCRSHLEFCAPLLKKYNFNATFFISRPQCWFDDCPAGYLSGREIAELHSLGFEIGSHTMNHPDMRIISDDECRSEIRLLNGFFKQYGIPEPVSFAYPGGPYAANAAKILPEFNLKYARTTEHGLWLHAETDNMRIPCFSISENNHDNFSKALNLLENSSDGAAVILYHGVPDRPHPGCNTEPETFREHMKLLYEKNFRVINMAEYGNSQS